MKETFRAFSTTDLSRRSGDVVAAALREPVLLTQHKKARLIVLSVEEYELRTAQKAPDTRTVARLKDMPADLADDFRAAATAYIQGEDG
jgi:PHD/YefM family antitoxin component YafN of YafNO toxin-antitoxin module